MPTRSEDIEEMEQKVAIEHRCRAEHTGKEVAHVRIEFYGKQPEFQVETFLLIGHATADTAFAWKWPLVQKERNKPSEVITSLKTSKIISPVEAVNDWAAKLL